MTLEEYRNQQHEIDLVVFHGIFKTQNAHGEWNVLPKMFAAAHCSRKLSIYTTISLV